MNYIWRYADHFTNPFSALKDYQCFINALKDGPEDTVMLSRQVFGLRNRLESIGAIEIIEDFFTTVNFIPDPRRFNKTAKELWRYYREHLKDSGQILSNRYFNFPSEKFVIENLIQNLQDLKFLSDLVSDVEYEQWLERSAKKS